MKVYSAILTLLLVAATAGCGAAGDTATSAEGGPADATNAAAATGKEARYPVPEAAPGDEPLEKLVAENLEVGDGPVARWGDEVTVRYVGVYYRTGKLYTQHWGSTYTLELDGKTIGPGWQKGIHGMRVGGRRELLIPARLIWHGADGDLAYIMELKKVKPGAGPVEPGSGPGRPAANSYGQKPPFAAITVRNGKKKPKIDPPDRPEPTDLLTRDLELGSGPAAKEGDEAHVYYAGALYKSGDVRFYGWRPSPPVAVNLGAGVWGGAWEKGIEGMKVGGRREVIIPSHALNGYPAVDYVIEMVGLEPGAGEQ